MRVHFTHGKRALVADLADALPIAIPLDFDGPQPVHFGARPAHAAPLEAGGFVGDVRAGGSCNCEELRLTPHCNGTHTEGVGHLTTDRVPVTASLRGGLLVAGVVSVATHGPTATVESTHPAPTADDRLITAAALAAACGVLAPFWQPGAPAEWFPEALVVRTLPNGTDKLSRAYVGESPAPYLTREAAEWLVAHGVMHLIVDLPSIDRAHDGGQLTAHRVFFGLPPGAKRLAEASRPQATITELAFVAPMVRDGWYLLDLQVPAFLTDAAPSRPLLYPVRDEPG
jgi:arylformamidase